MIAEYAANAAAANPQKEYAYRNGQTLFEAEVPAGSGGNAPTFTDDPLQAQVTEIKAVHLTELRDAVNLLRARAGLSAATWTPEPTIQGFTPPYQMLVRWEGTPFKTAGVLPTVSSSSNEPPKKASLIKRIKRITLLPVQFVLSALRPGETNSSSMHFDETRDGLATIATPPPPSAQETQPAVTTAVVPIYPLVALHAHLIGEVVIELRINADGSVMSVDPISGAPLLVGGSRSVARLWKFAPTTDKTSIRTARLTFVYRLVPRNTPSDRLRPVFKPPYRMEVEGAMPDQGPLP